VSRRHPTLKSLARHLRPTAADFAAAGALHDPSLLLQAQAAQSHGAVPSTPRPRRSGVRSSIRRALAGILV
jgi:hypothetical protein